jgi:hypothetical protein
MPESLTPGRFPKLEQARAEAQKRRQELDILLQTEMGRGDSTHSYNSEDTSLVVFGSLARDEWTSGSDLDWTYLIDGQANSDHLVIAQGIHRVLQKHSDRFPSPGPTGIFGNMAFSHEIIHQIGGQFDTNRNTTQRILLLLESAPIGRGAQAYERVIKAVINRYLEEDSHLLTEDGQAYRVPRFLLNDIVRFWRTMAVDFASKQRDRGGEGWGLRNAKLRMSRKLIFASGLLLCFGCHLDADLKNNISTEKDAIRLNLVNHIREWVRLTPMEIVARSMDMYGVLEEIKKNFFSSYAAFLEVLDDPKSRAKLQQLRAADSRHDSEFGHIKDISRVFERSLDHIFFENEHLKLLTREYGVF